MGASGGGRSPCLLLGWPGHLSLLPAPSRTRSGHPDLRREGNLSSSCHGAQPFHPVYLAVAEGTRRTLTSSLKNDKRREGEGREKGRKCRTKRRGLFKGPFKLTPPRTSPPLQRISRRDPCPLQRGEQGCRLSVRRLLPLPCSLPLQDCNPQHSQLAPSLTTLPFSHEQRQEASRQNGQTSWVGFNHRGPYVLKYPDILGLRLKEQSQLLLGNSSLSRSKHQVLPRAFAKKGFVDLLQNLRKAERLKQERGFQSM